LSPWAPVYPGVIHDECPGVIQRDTRGCRPWALSGSALADIRTGVNGSHCRGRSVARFWFRGKRRAWGVNNAERVAVLPTKGPDAL
jgi:hypothetical protein